METNVVINTFVKETGGSVASQLEACTRCGMCAEACHFYQATGNPEYAPVWKIELLKRAYEQRFTLIGKMKLALGIDKRITDEEISHFSQIVYEACTMCNKCSMVCPMGIQIGPLIHEVRAGFSDAGIVPADLMAAVNKQVEEGSPLGVTDDVYESRMEWVADEWEVDLPMDVKGADTLVVFSSIEVMKFPENIAAIAKILNTAGEKWTLSTHAREVVNFGFYEGNAERTKMFLKRVFDGAVELGVKKIVVTECGSRLRCLALDFLQSDGRPRRDRDHSHRWADRRISQSRPHQVKRRCAGWEWNHYLPRCLQDSAQRRSHQGTQNRTEPSGPTRLQRNVTQSRRSNLLRRWRRRHCHQRS